jgi:hypothetical protein
MWCDDPLVRAFRRLGYNVLLAPSANFAPLLVLESDGHRRVAPIGPLKHELPAPADHPLPTVHQNDAAPNITVTRTRRLDGKLGVDALARLLAPLGVPGVAGALSRASGLEIVLKDVRRDWSSSGDVARYLESGAQAGSEHVRNATADSRLFVVTSILKSASLSTIVTRKVAESIEAEAGVPGSPVDISLEETAASSHSTVVTFTGQSALSFAFQAVRLIYEDGVYTDYASAHGMSGYALEAESGAAEGMLLLDDDLIELAD